MTTTAKKTRVKKQALTPQALQRELNKHFGAGTLLFADDPSLAIERIPSGVLAVDYVTNGGWARGRHVELHGSFGVGKTALATRSIASAQTMGLRCGFVDAEKTWDPKFARHLGVDLKALAFERQHEHGERCIDVIEAMLYSELFDVIVLDSIAALLPKAEKDVQMDNTSYGTQQAKLMSKALRKLTTANRKTVLIYINQQRESVGSLYGPKMVTSGGRAMAFYAGTRLELSQVENIMSAQDLVDPKTGNTVSKQVVKAHRVLIRVAKDKTGARPGDQTTVVFDYKLSDFDPLEDLMYLGRRLGLVKQRKSGKTYSWWIEGHEDLKKLGRNNFKAWLSRNPTHADELEDLICNYEGEEE